MSNKYLNLYNLKYLKYRSKYLTLKKSMKGGGGERIKIHIRGSSEENIRDMDIISNKSIVEQIATSLGINITTIRVLLDDCLIEPYHTAEDCMLTDEDILKVDKIK